MKKIDLVPLELGGVQKSAVDAESEEDVLLSKTSELSLLDEDDGGPEQHEQNTDRARSPKISMTPLGLKRLPEHFYRHTPVRSSPLKNVVQEADDVEMEVESDSEVAPDVTMDDAGNTSFGKKLSDTTRAILSPTILGARLATHSNSPIVRKNLTEKLIHVDEDEDLDFSENGLGTAYKSTPIKGGALVHRKVQTPDSSFDTTSETSEDLSEDSVDSSDTSSSAFKTPSVRTPWGNQPIQLQMHHHHYYPPSSPGFSPQHYNYPYEGDYDPANSQVAILPAPWSKFASPKAPTPYLISSYLQLIFNAITSSVIIYILISAIKTVKSDINSKMEEYAADIAMEVSRCTRSYIENKCDPETRVFALEKLCNEWEKCMNRDPLTQSGKASVSAETLGLILNSLIEPIGTKAMIIFIFGIVAWAFTSNFIFGFVRAKSYYGWDYHVPLLEHHQQNQAQAQPQLTGPNQPPNQAANGWDYSYSTPKH